MHTCTHVHKHFHLDTCTHRCTQWYLQLQATHTHTPPFWILHTLHTVPKSPTLDLGKTCTFPITSTYFHHFLVEELCLPVRSLLCKRHIYIYWTRYLLFQNIFWLSSPSVEVQQEYSALDPTSLTHVSQKCMTHKWTTQNPANSPTSFRPDQCCRKYKWICDGFAQRYVIHANKFAHCFVLP